MAPDRGTGAPERNEIEPEEVLRAKYFDYCSAQVADLLLLLPPDEIYLLTDRARRRAGAADAGFGDVVWLATEGLRERLALPPFEVWVEDYRENPERYEQYFLLWDS